MLVLTRRIGEKLVIGGEVVISLLDVKGDKVRIGVSAPVHIRVDREEVHERRAELASTPAQISSAVVLARRMKSRSLLRNG